MAGNIQNVNVKKIREECRDYWKQAIAVNTAVHNIETEIKRLTTVWTGKRMNTIIEKWNTHSKTLDEDIQYFSSKIVAIIFEIQLQYEYMEASKPSDIAAAASYTKINKINLTDATSIKYDNAQVQSISKSIYNNMDKLSNDITKLVRRLNSMQAYSDSLKTLATTYERIANSLRQTINTLVNVIIKNEIEKAIKDVQVTEQYNEKDAKRAATTTKK